MIRRQVSEGAFGTYLEKRKKFDPEKGNVLPWLKTVFKNQARDLARQAQRQPVGSSPLNPISIDGMGAEEGSGYQVEDVKAGNKVDLIEKRNHLVDHGEFLSVNIETLEPLGGSGSRVNYNSIFSLAVRIAMASAIKTSTPDISFLNAFSLAENLVRWPEELRTASIQKDWHCAEQIWEALKEEMINGAVDSSYTVDRLCRAVASLSGGFVRFTPEKWYQWVKRAKARAQEQIDQDIWTMYFARLLPDHRKRGNRKNRPG